MVRKGYNAEYWVKKRLEYKFGEGHVVKVAVSQMAPDYIAFASLKRGVSYTIWGVEVKSTIKRKLYLKPRDKKQWIQFRRWMIRTGIPVVYWVVTKDAGKRNLEIMTHEEFGNRYVGGIK